MYKAYTFAFIISSISAFFGYYVKGGALEIGSASTKAVVISCIMILFADYILAALFIIITMRIAGISLLILLIINIVVGMNRNNGSNYLSSYSLDELYPSICNEACLNKWTFPDKRYSNSDIETGKKFLKDDIRLDSAKNTEEKIKLIAGYLHSALHDQTGNPGALIRSLEPFQQLQLLLKDTSQKLWCGNFQAIFGFLSTTAGLKNRYVEVTSLGTTHELNEIFSPTYNKWIMVDVTRNNIFITKENLPLSTAEYFNLQLKGQPINLHTVKNKADKSANFDTVLREAGKSDEYFTNNALLRYYLKMDLKEIYSLPAKTKRYIMADPWFVVYDPKNKHDNTLFRVRQFFIAAFCITLLLNIYLVLKKFLFK